MKRELPEKFIENMKKQLPETEWEAFFAVYSEPPVKGVRLNPLKGEPSVSREKLPFLGERIAWEEHGYYATADKLGVSPYHHAGVFYSQEPSAMSAAPLLEVLPHERVLDLCSAPGGKGTQLACRMDGKGVIVLNEPIFSRAKILSGNVERMGVKNALVLSEYPETLSKRLEGYFDKILVDAPCSGEGMFRKNADEALNEWSEENIALCAARQEEILSCAVKMLKVGGRLVYSTCTFSCQEDEEQVQKLVGRFPYMRLIKQEKLYPHKIKGEGHFVALLEKTGESEQPNIKALKPCVSRDSERAYRAFEKEFFHHKFAEILHEVNGVLYALPDGIFDWKGLQALRVGVRLGEVKNGRFTPDHALVMCARKDEMKNVVDFTAEDSRIAQYLHGETIRYDAPNGYCAVCADGFPIGLGKAVNGTVKNHLPKGLRI